ncbi:hypothetical protein BDP27DRAFT_1427751 [Rhodocollybia butyracea]|uniref:Uncharacterized protein n=1 Tax=Rhodocollybia butyracea TaxID=206335 RepID=A0A9P5PEY4_9AGAR|nr:hypothetical protein BDP27DRAFT_1427751 [Rhodocollybia butyracea]
MPKNILTTSTSKSTPAAQTKKCPASDQPKCNSSAPASKPKKSHHAAPPSEADVVLVQKAKHKVPEEASSDEATGNADEEYDTPCPKKPVKKRAKKKAKAVDEADSAGEDLNWVEQQDPLPNVAEPSDAPAKGTLEWHKWNLHQFISTKQLEGSVLQALLEMSTSPSLHKYSQDPFPTGQAQVTSQTFAIFG